MACARCPSERRRCRLCAARPSIAAIGIPHGDVELTVENQEEFVGFFVDVPEMLSLGMGDPDVVIIDLADDSRTVDVVKRPERLG